MISVIGLNNELAKANVIHLKSTTISPLLPQYHMLYVTHNKIFKHCDFQTTQRRYIFINTRDLPLAHRMIGRVQVMHPTIKEQRQL